MSYGTAIHILLNINEYTEQEILKAVQKILSMSTINSTPKQALKSTPKQALLNGLRWFFDNCTVEEGGGEE